MGLADRFEEGTGLSSAFRAWLDRPVAGGARWALATCGVVAFLIGLELITGFVLSLHYSPSVTTAWASIAFLEERIQGGTLVRGLHVFGASALAIALVVHYLRVVATAAYRKPHQATWTVGLLIAVVLAAFAVTGTVLPFDQNAYWATRVRMGLAGVTPGVGPALQGIAQGGEDVGNITLTRFYAVHAILLPGLLVGLALLRSRLKKRAEAGLPVGATSRWFPGQAVRTLLLATLTLGVLFALVRMKGGAPLEAPADPASSYEARPEWILPLYQFVKFFPPSLAFVGSQVIPLLLLVALAALPFVDHGTGTGGRRPGLVLALAPLAAAIGLGALAVLNDAANEHLHKSQAVAAMDAADARALFVQHGGVPPEGPLALYDLDPVRVGKRVFQEHCTSCHSLDGRPDQKGPDLGHYRTTGWLTEVIRAPNSPRFWGEHDTMAATGGTPAEISALVDFVVSLESEAAAKSLGAARVEKGRLVWEDKQCGCCHKSKPAGGASASGGRAGGRSASADAGDDDGPNLAGYGSDEWLTAFIKNPKASRFMGKKGRMTPFEDKLADAQVQAVITYLRSPEVRERE